MRHQRTSVGFAVLIVIGLAACMEGSQAAPPRPPASLPSGATALSLPTTPPEATIPEHWACAGNTIQPARVVRQGDAVVFILQTTGKPIDLVWPRGFSARLLNGRAEVVSPVGTVVLQEGQIFSDIISGVPNICQVNGVYFPPAS